MKKRSEKQGLRDYIEAVAFVSESFPHERTDVFSAGRTTCWFEPGVNGSGWIVLTWDDGQIETTFGPDLHPNALWPIIGYCHYHQIRMAWKDAESAPFDFPEKVEELSAFHAAEVMKAQLLALPKGSPARIEP